ncbi:hypothetical protein T069G_00744 [Trichoderma breve]|uniref:Uncharacterized protein n=1 Tax=Trichoderma breve TaxID=2034170 RepID=A0A9W9ECN1_9HYPO|nr:hypothetical protein T069G_00744 [Trichoderma breve]KAJ4864214.1 hypothetical protein T069G_00744 [Trichoderma breve]
MASQDRHEQLQECYPDESWALGIARVRKMVAKSKNKGTAAPSKKKEAVTTSKGKETVTTPSKNESSGEFSSENEINKTAMSLEFPQSSNQAAEPSSSKRKKLNEMEISETTETVSKVKLDDRTHLELEELKMSYNALHTAHQYLVKVQRDGDAETGRLIYELKMKLNEIQIKIERQVDILDLKQGRNEREFSRAMETNQERIMTELELSNNRHESELRLLRLKLERLAKENEQLKKENLEQKAGKRKLEERIYALEESFNGFRAEHTWKVGEMWRRMMGME